MDIIEERAAKNLNAIMKVPYIMSEIKFFTGLAKVKRLSKETLIKKMKILEEKSRSAYNSYFSFCYSRFGSDNGLSVSKEFSSPYGTILHYPLLVLDDIFFLSHSIDRYEERCNDQAPLIGASCVEVIYRTNTSLDRMALLIAYHLYNGELSYHMDGANSVHVKIGDFGILAITKINEAYLVKTFLSIDMLGYIDWKEIGGRIRVGFDKWLDKAFKFR